jgi:succinate dehydrogenase/fumarate reductase flavoprotein subunit
MCGGHGMSGVRVNEKAESSVPGLYVAGDVASVPKQHLTGAFVFGEVAAEAAMDFIASQPDTKLDEGQVRAATLERDRRFTTVGREIQVGELEYKVRRFIGDYVISPKNAVKLNRWLEWAERFKSEIRDQVLVRDAHELSKLYEIENIVHCATWSAMASLERKESRWGEAHRRTDFPERDDANWLRHVVVSQGEGLEDIRVNTRPVIGLDGKAVWS